jgi:hypothetical protein
MCCKRAKVITKMCMFEWEKGKCETNQRVLENVAEKEGMSLGRV